MWRCDRFIFSRFKLFYMELKLFRRIHKKDYVFITCKRISQASCKLASRRNKKKETNKQKNIIPKDLSTSTKIITKKWLVPRIWGLPSLLRWLVRIRLRLRETLTLLRIWGTRLGRIWRTWRISRVIGLLGVTGVLCWLLWIRLSRVTICRVLRVTSVRWGACWVPVTKNKMKFDWKLVYELTQMVERLEVLEVDQELEVFEKICQK